MALSDEGKGLGDSSSRMSPMNELDVNLRRRVVSGGDALGLSQYLFELKCVAVLVEGFSGEPYSHFEACPAILREVAKCKSVSKLLEFVFEELDVRGEGVVHDYGPVKNVSTHL